MEKIKNHLKRTKKITIAETFKKANWSKDTQLGTSSNDANIQSFATSRTLNSQAMPSPCRNFTPSRPSWIGISESASPWIHKTGVCKSIRWLSLNQNSANSEAIHLSDNDADWVTYRLPLYRGATNRYQQGALRSNLSAVITQSRIQYYLLCVVCYSRCE